MQTLEVETRPASRHRSEADGEQSEGRRSDLAPSPPVTLFVTVVGALVNVAIASGKSGLPAVVANLLLFGLCVLFFYVLDRIVGDRLSLGSGAGMCSPGDVVEPESFARSECDGAVAAKVADGSGACVSDNPGGYG